MEISEESKTDGNPDEACGKINNDVHIFEGVTRLTLEQIQSNKLT